ncbi:hypothetical protein FB45DRAFT_1039934 [Roridomyces roridus]|uniref:Uncharacterized protein n=1 Tax=Roridomyces roridus TaxID=1738132 RepID=A0AAD7B1H3_9AGAR|nr:hypothetical protein FB45DRAFT_1039934 [Roridomyces roridus]
MSDGATPPIVSTLVVPTATNDPTLQSTETTFPPPTFIGPTLPAIVITGTRNEEDIEMTPPNVLNPRQDEDIDMPHPNVLNPRQDEDIDMPHPASNSQDEEINLGATGPELPGNTHARRNPDVPIIPSRVRYRKPKEKNLAQLTRVRRQMRANKAQALADDIRDIRQAVENMLPEVAAKHSVTVKALRQRIYNGAGLKTKRNLSTYNAKVCCVMETLNEGLELGTRYTMKDAKAMIKADPSLMEDIEPEFLEQMIARLEAQRVLTRTGLRGDNKAAAIDAQRTLAVLGELVTALYRRTGILGFCFFTRGNYNDITTPLSIESGDALKFCSEVLNREPELITAALELWSMQRSSGAITAPSTEKMRALGAAMIKSGLVQITGKSNINMNFENYVKSIVYGKHVALLGWPKGVPWKRCAQQTVAADVRAIYKALKDGSLKWKKLATEEEEEAEERRFNRLITKGLAPEAKERKVRKDFRASARASADSDDEVVPESGGEEDVPESGGEENVPESGDEQQFAGYNGDYSDDDISRRKKAKSKSKSTAAKTTKATATKTTKVAATKTTKAAATKTTKAAASKSTKAAASKSTAKPTPKSTASKPKPPTKPSAKTKPAPKPFVPTAPPPKYIFKNGKHIPNGAAVDEHARRMVQERGEYERQMRRRKGGNESGSDGENDSASGDDEREEQVVPTKQGPPTKRRRTDEEPEEQPAKKTKKTTDKRPREDSEDEGEQPVAKKAKLVVELPRPRPAWKGALQGKKGGPPGLRPHELPQLGAESE